MAAAIPVATFSGILEREMEVPTEVPARLASLNQTLCRTLDKRTFNCFVMAEIDTRTGHVHLAFCGSPYALHVRDADVAEIAIDEYPLGVRASSTYDSAELQIEADDYLVLYSDGIP